MSAPAASAWHAAFAAALLDPRAPPPGLVAWNGSDPGVRLDVYRNNVAVSLIEALGAGFPATRAELGPDRFATLAHAFLLAEPPRSPVLVEWGDGLADFIARFPPAADLPYLPDLARLERARVLAYHAPDAVPLDPAEIAARLAEPAGLPGARLVLDPSLRVLRSAHAAVSLWAAHQGLGDLHGLDLARPECALVLRTGEAVPVLPVARPTADFVAALAAGVPLGEAAALGAEGPGFDLAADLALLIRHGAVCAWHSPSRSPCYSPGDDMP